MLEFGVKSRKATMGSLKGQTVFIAVQKGQQKLTPEMVLERIVKETSLSEGDARNVIIMLRNLIVECARLGIGLDLGDIFSLRTAVPSKMEEKEENVTADSLKRPRIIVSWKEPVRKALKQVQVEVDNPKRRNMKAKKKDGGKKKEESGEAEP